METSPDKEIHTEFKRAVLVYIAAKTYELHGLQLLVKRKTEQFGTDMNIFNTVKVITEDFSKLPGDAT